MSTPRLEAMERHPAGKAGRPTIAELVSELAVLAHRRESVEVHMAQVRDEINEAMELNR